MASLSNIRGEVAVEINAFLTASDEAASSSPWK